MCLNVETISYFGDSELPKVNESESELLSISVCLWGLGLTCARLMSKSSLVRLQPKTQNKVRGWNVLNEWKQNLA